MPFWNSGVYQKHIIYSYKERLFKLIHVQYCHVIIVTNGKLYNLVTIKQHIRYTAVVTKTTILV